MPKAKGRVQRPRQRSRVHAVILTFDVTCRAAVISAPVFSESDACLGYETLSFGSAKSTDVAMKWISDAKREARDLDLPLLIVCSDPRVSDMWIHVKVDEAEWRSQLFGRSKLSASAFANKHLDAPPLLSEEVASAICLRAWAERAEQSHEALKPRKKKAA